MRIAIIALALTAAPALAQLGSLTPPPGAVTETMKPLDIVEPRTPVGPDTTPGDVGSVFLIDEPGSYYLTSDVFGEPGKNGIGIDADNVTLDLNGFTVYATSTGGVGSTEGAGIIAFSGTTDTTVRDGTVQGWPEGGVVIQSTPSTVEDVHARRCGTFGFDLAFGDARASRLTAHSCGDPANPATTGGFRIGSNASVTDASTRGGQTGFIVIGDAVTMHRCTSIIPNGVGFDCSIAITISLHNCTVRDGSDHGYVLGNNNTALLSECVVQNSNGSGFVNPTQGISNSLTMHRCVASDCNLRGFDLSAAAITLSECVAINNQSEGFYLRTDSVDPSALLSRCHASSNQDSGFAAEFPAVFRDCVSSHNTEAGFVSSGGSYHGCIAKQNDDDGFRLGSDVTLNKCQAIMNVENGLSASSSITIESSTFRNNQGIGVTIGGVEAVIRDCVFDANGSVAMLVGANGLVERCTVVAHTVSPLIIGQGSVFRDCDVARNASPGIEITQNDVTIINNRFADNGDVGISVTGQNARIERNEIVNSNVIALDIAPNLGAIVHSNRFVGNAFNYATFAGNTYAPQAGITDPNPSPLANIID